jgi:hypothetical protein
MDIRKIGGKIVRGIAEAWARIVEYAPDVWAWLGKWVDKILSAFYQPGDEKKVSMKRVVAALLIYRWAVMVDSVVTLGGLIALTLSTLGFAVALLVFAAITKT